jgi:hypothetical protein
MAFQDLNKTTLKSYDHMVVRRSTEARFRWGWERATPQFATRASTGRPPASAYHRPNPRAPCHTAGLKIRLN